MNVQPVQPKEFENQLRVRLECQVWDQLGVKFEDWLENQLWSQLGRQLYRQLGVQLRNKLKNECSAGDK